MSDDQATAPRAEIFEVGPRDGLQNEPRPIPTAEKLALIDLLSGAGFSRIEVASFVSPKWVPQMADGAEVLAGIQRAPGVSYAALVPNMQGLERALAARADEIAVFASAAEGFSRANINCSVDESLARLAPVARAAQEADLPVRGYVSCVTDCPYDGETDPGDVARVVARLMRMGCYEISLGDTLGQGTPERVAQMLKLVLEEAPADRLAGHFHATSGLALENIDAALDAGLRVFDAACGGLGGCPFAPGAAGNVATEDANAHLRRRGYETGLDEGVLARAAQMAQAMRAPAAR
ncbi:hydroxymethylglutaryl-CoA lyase [Brevirhabdus pacifica]|uniref:Hydroxymethylglutaryl-CoA lyase n=1 Tax=Brevirhabdus pacifica TaxID=1267768 RepID=A0A1U7DKS5_9RHOB|nr:hydroxymethylglutaryl-CoA lyase [Brevirhabdus pacifica]APX90604.1 hydroxymethylglutaryl-CoA lyase [Brevirhabdus pacifica]OWU78401.1 hydroxymethylglutaryl-CoA lyase [Loktanella sp. 22II-4b]PJJ85258.1 hydroxymethylglutaryl-CoA lyase [Brevirhabdus pacifica]